MERERAFQLVSGAIEETLFISAGGYTLDFSFRQLDADSLDVVNICVTIESVLINEGNKAVRNIELNKLRTVGDLVDFLEKNY